MLDVGNAVKGEDGNFAVTSLGDGGFELFEGGVGFAIECLGQGKRVVLNGVEGPGATRAGETIAAFAKQFDGGGAGLVAGVTETGRARNAMSRALLLDLFDILGELRDGLPGDAEVTAGVIADFESVRVEAFDLLPRHVVLFVGGKFKSLGDEKGGAEAVLFQQRPDECGVAGDRIIEGEDHDAIRDGFAVRRMKVRGQGEQCGEAELEHGFGTVGAAAPAVKIPPGAAAFESPSA